MQSLTDSAEPASADAPDPLQAVGERAQSAGRWLLHCRGWGRILRNTTVAYFEQAGSRMAAALSYYSIFVGGPVLLLTVALGTALFGEVPTKEMVTQLVERVLPPGADGATEVAQQMVRTSTPTASLALLAGLGSLLGFTRALSTSLNVTLNAEGTEPLRRTFLVGPLLLLAVLGLLWGAWMLRFLVETAQLSFGDQTSWFSEVLLTALAPLLLALVYFSIILALLPRVQLTRREVLVPASVAAVVWEAARHIFGWLTRADGFYLRVFGPLGGVVALLGWVYLSCAILVLTGQLAWAYAMERRGRGHFASHAPRRAGLQGWLQPYIGDNAVNEDQPI